MRLLLVKLSDWRKNAERTFVTIFVIKFMSKWNYNELACLNEILANLYPRDTDARRLAANAGLAVAQISFEGSSLGRWFNILEYANARDTVDGVVARALIENPDDDSLKGALNRQPPKTVKGPEAKEWEGPKASDRLEKLMGVRSTLVPISYFEIGVVRAKSIVRIVRSDGSLGTGFITSGNVLVTNNHVLPNVEAVQESIVQFNYQQNAEGLSAPVYEVKLLANTFKTSIENDWSIATIDGDVNTEWGAIELSKTNVKVGDHVNIIQHPGGGPKQISLFANVIVYIGGGRVQYLTDTLPGSSGSPVFDANWNIVALHHSGGWLTEPNADPKFTYYRNEGIAIECVIDGIAKP